MSSRNPECRRLFLLDGTALAYRAHFAFIRNPLTTTRGRNVSALYGFIITVLKILETEQPDFMAVAFDTKKPTFRHAKFPDYKATREKTPDELIAQLGDIRDAAASLGIPVIELDGWEADDVIGTLAVKGAAKDLDVSMVTGDKDFMQLVSDRIRIYNPTRPDEDVVIQDIEAVKEKFGVEPGRVIEVMGLMGDKSDNIPGVTGVGVKTAIKLIDQFGDMDALYANLDAVKSNALRTKLETHRDDAFLSRELVTIDVEAPVDHAPEELTLGTRDVTALQALCRDNEFSSLLERLVGEKPSAPARLTRDYRLVKDEKIYAAFLKELKAARALVIDLETTSLDPLRADIVGIAVAFEEGVAWYLPARAPASLFGGEEGHLDRYLADLAPVLADPGVEIAGQNIKYDLKVLHRAGVTEVKSVTFDTMVAHYLLFPGDLRHNLDYLSLKYLDVKKIPITDLIGKGKKQISMADVPVERVCEYACEDVDMTLRLKRIFEKDLDKEGFTELFHDLEMPLVRVLERMEREGVRVDVKRLKAMSKDMERSLDELEESIHEMAGMRFNVNSTQQLGKVLFEHLELQKELGIKRVKKTKTGYATNAEVLQSMAAHPLPRALLEYRQIKKLRSTYVEALPRLVNPETGRIHASFNQTVAATGRLSSSDPNLQNIPVRTEMGRKIRKAFVARDEDHLLLAADYSQIELRILAHVSGDPTLVDAFRRGEDIHRNTAALIFDVEPSEVTKEMRSQAKTINFGIIYGMGPHRLARETNISFFEAKRFIEAYFEAFAGVKNYIDRTLEEARELESVTTLLGRKRPVEDINATNSQVRSNAENMAVNTPIQGTAADLIKRAMVDIHEAMDAEGLESAMILQVHDELVFDVPFDELTRMKELVREKMEGALKLDVPVQVDMDTGRDWLEAH